MIFYCLMPCRKSVMDYIYGTWFRCRECGRWMSHIPGGKP